MSIEKTADVVPVAQWLELRGRHFFHFDGGGKFVRDDAYVTQALFDDVFGVIPADVTHVAWFNRWKYPPAIALEPISALRSHAG